MKRVVMLAVLTVMCFHYRRLMVEYRSWALEDHQFAMELLKERCQTTRTDGPST
jgi:hypothetical protein